MGKADRLRLLRWYLGLIKINKAKLECFYQGCQDEKEWRECMQSKCLEEMIEKEV